MPFFSKGSTRGPSAGGCANDAGGTAHRVNVAVTVVLLCRRYAAGWRLRGRRAEAAGCAA